MKDSTAPKVLCCPTAFKGSFGVAEAAAAMARGVEAVYGPGSAVLLPLSDGGPGLLEALESASPPLSSVRETASVSGPLGGPATVRFLSQGDEMIIESADAVGLELIPPTDRNPLRATSRGLGDAISFAARLGAARLVVGLGGSATVDGGTGMARALGYRFLDATGRELPEGGGALIELARIEDGDAAAAAGIEEVTALADVRSPLCGPDGAARRFAAQKGASPDDVERLEAGLARLAEVIERDGGQKVAEIEGAGAAGGLGAGCVAFLGARLLPGAPWVLARLGFDRALEACDLVVTGEGAWDGTSGLGKIVHEVARRAKAARRPVLLACGRVERAGPDSAEGGRPGDAGGSAPPGPVIVGGGGEWLDAEGLSRLVASSLREHGERLQSSGGPA
jgi:glycerate kinase